MASDSENSDLVQPIYWELFCEAAAQAELYQETAGAQGDIWWNWPEAIAWIGSRDVRNIASLRYWSAHYGELVGGELGSVLRAQHFMAGKCCRSMAAEQEAQHALIAAIERGAVRALGSDNFGGVPRELATEYWYKGVVEYVARGSQLIGAKATKIVRAVDIAVSRADLWAEFPDTEKKNVPVRWSGDEIEQWCREWLEGGHGNGPPTSPKVYSGEARAWAVFRTLPQAAAQSRDYSFRPLFK